MKSPTRLFFIRHGEVEASYQKVFGGRIDMELSPFGHQQAEMVARYLERYPFDAIYASPMRRVQQTLRDLAARQSRQPIILPGLREVDFGEWTGLSWEQVEQRFSVSPFTWVDQLEHGAINGAESVPHYRERIEAALGQIRAEQCERTVAVVCHGGVIRMALAILLDLPFKKTAGFDVEYASVTVVDWLPHKAVVQLMNFTPWRDLA